MDVVFQVAMALHVECHPTYAVLQTKTREELADWVRAQLRECGFPTVAMGSSWGVLVDK